MDDVFFVQILQPFHNLNCVYTYKRLIKLAKAIENLSNWATWDHLKHKIYLIVSIALETMVLYDIGMVQVFQNIDLVLDWVELALPSLTICFCTKLDTLYGK